MSLILSRLGCRCIRRIARTGSGRESRPNAIPPSRSRRFAGTWSARFSATRRGRSPAGRTPRTRSTAPSWSPRWTGRRPTRWPTAGGPIRCGSTSRSASTATSRAGESTSGAPTWSTNCARRCSPRRRLEFVGLMGIPPLGSDPDDAFARLQAEHQRVQGALPAAPRAVGRDVQRPRSGRQTWFDVCACRYRAIGATSSNVTMSSHSSHIFITDTSSSRRVQR